MTQTTLAVLAAVALAAAAGCGSQAPLERHAILYVLRQGRTSKMAASAFELPVTTIHTHSRRGLQRLRALLDSDTPGTSLGQQSGSTHPAGS